MPGFESLAGAAPLVTPKGMGDLLPPEAAQRRALAQRVLRTFELSGYALVMPPVFEHADVLQRGNDMLDSRDLLRFVEPESGEVAVLRPDITPQIARIVATRLTDRKPPFRLCYEGRVFRRQRGRARNHRQISQAGIECVGLPGTAGDAEAIALAVRACEDAGLTDFKVELSDIRLVRSLLAAIPERGRAAVSEALALKDGASLKAVAQNAGAARTAGSQLEALLSHYGDVDVLASARSYFRSKEAQTSLKSLLLTVERLAALGLRDRLCFDLSATRGLSYYTGMHFSILAVGPGEPLGGGGRYDGLLQRFGFDAPAVGFALDLGHIQWSLSTARGASMQAPELRVVVVGKDVRRIQEAVERLRQGDVIAATLPDGEGPRSLAFARAWGYDAVITIAGKSASLARVDNNVKHVLRSIDPILVRRLARSKTLKSTRREG